MNITLRLRENVSIFQRCLEDPENAKMSLVVPENPEFHMMPLSSIRKTLKYVFLWLSWGPWSFNLKLEIELIKYFNDNYYF